MPLAMLSGMEKLPEQNFDPGWPEFLEDEDGDTYVRIRDGTRTQADPPLGNSCLYALVIDKRAKVVSQQNQCMPAFPWTQGTITMHAMPWDSPEKMAHAKVPPLDPLPEGYHYEEEDWLTTD